MTRMSLFSLILLNSYSTQTIKTFSYTIINIHSSSIIFFTIFMNTIIQIFNNIFTAFTIIRSHFLLVFYIHFNVRIHINFITIKWCHSNKF
mmetsp:Transcript_122149/g.296481  ORF Transcript_122149/g.296481 Transcript_122149/m.296481 type:complete len:91 (-) Transcript_122149:33-305(-)